MGCVTVNFYIENVSTTCEVVIRRLNLCLFQGCALIVYWNVVGISIVVAVGHARDNTKLLAVFLCKLTAESFGWCGENRVVVMILLAESVGSVAHICHNLESEFLCFLAFTMVVTNKGYKAFCQTDKAYTQSSMVDDTFYRFFWFQFLGTYPEIFHQQRELLGHCCLLELEAFIKLLGCNLQDVVQFCKEHVDALLFVLYAHAFDGKFNNIDGRETEVSTCNTCLFSPTVFEHAGAATHCGNFPLVAFWIICMPFLILVECGIEVEEIGEEATCCHLAS